MRYTLIYVVFIISSPLMGQMSFQDDTIRINEVVISSKKIISDPAGYKKVTIDSSVLKNYSHRTLADILSENSKIFIKSYGMGGTATPSFRGTGASHTQLTWNSVNINHPMLGQSDLSLIPAGLVDDIQIYFGGASMILGSGGIGGTINLETKPEWKKESLISVNPGFGTYGRYTGLIKVKSGTAQFQTITKAFLQSSENDFRYLNTATGNEPVWESRKNSQVRQKGFIQELYFRKSKNVFSSRIWYQSASRNLPSSMLTLQPNSAETQSDESLRTMLNYDMSKGRNSFTVTGAWLYNRLNYFNRLASIDSRNQSETMILKADMERVAGEKIKLKIVLNEELSTVKTNNYYFSKSRNTTTLTASAERDFGKRIGTMILLREIVDKSTFLIPDFSAGFQFRLADETEYFLKANVSRNSKVPTMNDMFWNPGGNPQLKNEHAFIYELTYEMKQIISSPLTIRYDLSFFRNSISDMILWHPGEYSYWTADNILRVNSTGMETSVSLVYTRNDFNASFDGGYSFTNARNVGSNENNDLSAGKQLIYTPENQANTSLNVRFRNVYSSWVSNMTGRRFITVDNSKFLPGYFINNIIAGVKLDMKGSSFDVNFCIDNLFNVNYQTIAYYPLPGRSYYFKLFFQIIK